MTVQYLLRDWAWESVERRSALHVAVLEVSAVIDEDSRDVVIFGQGNGAV